MFTVAASTFTLNTTTLGEYKVQREKHLKVGTYSFGLAL